MLRYSIVKKRGKKGSPSALQPRNFLNRLHANGGNANHSGQDFGFGQQPKLQLDLDGTASPRQHPGLVLGKSQVVMKLHGFKI